MGIVKTVNAMGMEVVTTAAASAAAAPATASEAPATASAATAAQTLQEQGR